MNTTNSNNAPKKTFGDKLRDFFGNSYTKVDILSCAFLAMFIMLVFAVALKLNKIFPFGDNIMSSYDMLAQVAPFIEHFFDVIEGRSSLFYSFSIVGGADVFGTLAYCCVSPFTPIFLLFGKGNVYYGTSIVLPLKIIAVAISAYIYLRKRFENISPVMRIALALSYAFCGYLYVANTYINWVDILIYLPILALGFRRLVKFGKIKTFVVGLCLIIYTCFSIACFSLLIIYPLAFAYCCIVIPKANRKRAIVNLVFALCLAVGFSLPILIPSLCAYLVSGRSAGLFNGLFNELKADPLYYKLSYIATDALTVFFTFAYLVKYGVKRPIDRFLLLAALITLLPVLCDEVCIMLNFGSYNSYALRFGFLNGFYFFFVAARFLDGFKKNTELLYNLQDISQNLSNSNEQVISNSNEQDILSANEQDLPKVNRQNSANRQKDLKKRYNKPKRITIVLFYILPVCLCLGALVGGYFLCCAAQGDRIEKWFSSRFAHSLGGLEVTAIVFAIVAIIALCATLLVKFKKITPSFAAIILLITVCGQSAFYCENLVFGNKKETTDFDRIGVITDFVQTLDDGEYARIKFKKDYLTADMPFTLHTQSYSVFSSVVNDKNFAPSRFFSFGGNGNNTAKSYYGSFFGDCLFGNRYYITESDSAERNYDAVSLAKEGEELPDIGDYRLYRNNYSFPSAFVTDGRVGEFENGKNLYEKYDTLIKSLGGSDLSLDKKGINSAMVSVDEDGCFKITISRKAGVYYFAVLDFEDDYKIEYSLGSNTKKYNLECDSINLQMSGSNYSTIKLYFGDNTSLTAEEVADCVTLYSFNDDLVKTISVRAQAKAGSLKLSAGKISVDVEAEENQYLFLNYIALPGHVATVNNKTVTIDDDLLGFMLIPLEKGKNEVVVEYSSPYVKYAVIGLIAALLIVFAYVFFTKRFDFHGGKIGRVICFAALSLCAVVVLIFMIFPIGVFVYKLIYLVIKTILRL